MDSHPQARLRGLRTDELTPGEVDTLRSLLIDAYGPDEDDRFTDDDWEHALGGIHFVLDLAGELVAHAAVVPRELHIAGRPLHAGYVEAVATSPRHQGAGLGTRIMREASAAITAGFELGALGTGAHHFYERLGWRTWRGPTFVRTPSGDRPTPDDDGYIMVLRTPTSPTLEDTDPISCEWRSGDVW